MSYIVFHNRLEANEDILKVEKLISNESIPRIAIHFAIENKPSCRVL